MKIAAIVLTFLPNIVFSQATPVQTVVGDNSSATVSKVVRVRYGNAKTLAALAANGAPVNVNADNLLQVIVLNGRAHDIAAVEQTIHELDVPAATQTSYKSKNIELVVSVISGSSNSEPTSGGPIPEAMMPVVKQLRAVFPYKSYQLLSSMLLRSSEGAKAHSQGVMKNLTNPGNASYQNGYSVVYDEARISPEEGKPTIHLRNFQFKADNIYIGTDIDLREGQKIVAGKANLDNNDLAVFVVLTARIVE